MRWPAWIVGMVLALWAVTWLAASPLLKWQAQKIATEKLARPVRIGAVDFRPWSLALTLRNVTVGGAIPADPPQLTIKRLYVRLAPESVLRLAPVLDAIEIDEPALRLRHLGGGHYDADDVIGRIFNAPKSLPNARPARFALYDIAVRGGRITFIDTPVRRTHEVRDLNLRLPFISNLPSQRAVDVTPQLAFTVDGSRFDSGAQTLPFDASRRTEALLRVRHFDLAPYLVYQPASLPVRVTAGVLDADLRLSFTQMPRPTLKVTGSASLSGAKVNDPAGTAALEVDRLAVQASDVRPLERLVHLTNVELTAPHLLASRNVQGRINWIPAPKTTARTPHPAQAARKPDAAAWRVAVDRVAITRGDVQWRDALPVSVASHPAPAVVHITPLALEARNVTWPVRQPATFSGQLALADVGTDMDAGMGVNAPPRQNHVTSATSKKSTVATANAVSAPSLAFQGQAQMSSINVSVQAHGLPLRLAQPYLKEILKPDLVGSVNADADLTWAAPAANGTGPAGNSPGLTLNASKLTLDQLALLGDSHGPRAARRHQRAGRSDKLLPGTLASIGTLTVEGAKINLPNRAVASD
ncbi:MAG: DUF748 domain-containing protein, partial [Burkholderiaceae bacterium]|nr:DUF748 domain-containing protein [Burkholderiaceae bacterium]